MKFLTGLIWFLLVLAENNVWVRVCVLFSCS